MKTTPDEAVKIEDAPAYRIYRCARLLRGHFRGLAEGAGLDLSQEQWFILNRLSHKDGVPQVELGDAVMDDRPNVTRLLTAMEERGLLRRGADPSDGRKQRVWLTAEGRRMNDRFAQLVPAARATTFKGVSREDLAATVRTLARLEQNLRTP